MPRHRRHVPTQEEDNRVFLATGYRYLPAFERGFPYPWCAKRTSKGWRVRDIPPDSSKPGVEFKGWKAAEEMLRSREILLQRIQNKEEQQIGQSTNEKSPTDKEGPIKKRKIAAARKAPPNPSDQKAVHDWFHHTPQVVQAQVAKLKEDEFQKFLSKKKVQIKKETKEREKKIKQEMKEKKESDRKMKQEAREREREAKIKSKAADDNVKKPPSSPAGIKQPPIPDSLPVSPIRRKHKRVTPKRNQQSHNSITLGEDPELDQMIEDIVLECTSGYGKRKEVQNKNKKSGVDFDGSAVSALREAALTMMTNKIDDTGKQTQYTKLVGTETNPEKEKQSYPAASNVSIKDSSHATSGTDDRITSMIQQLIGDVEGDFGCHFDDRAIEALKVAAKDIMTEE